jgi:hypothetical protein
MEISQGNSCVSYLYLKKTKSHVFSFGLFSFFFYKIEEHEGIIGPVQGREVGPVGKER